MNLNPTLANHRGMPDDRGHIIPPPDQPTTQSPMTIAISIIVILLLLLVALIGGFYVYIYYFRIQRPVPTLTGDAPLPGLDADVEILR
ncbi:MAG: hypothetical protein KDD83_26520, partial [Caldilineaceae bacterium]|nr:hypothetical protein [Caldilineaceae bacterium]